MEHRKAVATRALALVDLTDLGDATTAAAVDELCRRAVGPYGSAAAVCVWPRFVARAAERLDGTGVLVATVVNFPAGGTGVDAAMAETVAAVGDGADEIDVVLPYRAFLEGDLAAAAAMIEAVRSAAAPPVRLKVILETGAFPSPARVAEAAAFVIGRGADFVKTSTGKTSPAATPEAAEAILTVIHDLRAPVGFKAAGGIRSLDDAATYLALADRIMGPRWASPATFRFGASGLLDAFESELAGSAGARSDVADRPERRGRTRRAGAAVDATTPGVTPPVGRPATRT